MLFFTLLMLFGFENNLPASEVKVSEDKIVMENPKTVFESTNVDNRSELASKKDSDKDSYASTKVDVGQFRIHLNESLKQGSISFEEVKTKFTNLLVDKIIPYWYGTPWSFEGHTAVPNQGNIACGYFISTTLRDMGLKINRYKLAQKSPFDEAKTISCGIDIQSIAHEKTEKAFEEIDRLTQEGLYFIGFDKGHVGYLLKRKGQLFLIHSNYFSPGLVCMEPFEKSRAFKSFSKFYLVDISNNDILIKHWLDNRTVLL